MDVIYYGFALLIFVAVALTVEAVWQWWFSTQSKAAKRLSSRVESVRQERKGTIDANTPDLYRHRRYAQSQRAQEILENIPGINQFDEFLQQSGMGRSLGEHSAYTALFMLSAFLLSLLLLSSFWASLFLAALGAILPTLQVAARRDQRLRKIELQLPEAADLIGRSLRAGHALTATLQMLANEMPEPISAEFRIVADEINFGAPLGNALQRLGHRVPLTDLRYMVVAILIQREAGGNLSEIMGNVSLMVRQRLKLLGDVRALSAEGRLSAWVLCLLPVALAGFFMLTQPDYLSKFFDDPIGPTLLMAALAMMAFGVLWMRQIIRIRV